MKDLFGYESESQPAPFAYPHGPGHRQVPTSVEAAESMRKHVGPLQRRILNYLIERGAHGATYDEVMLGCRLGAPTVCPRLLELAKAGLIRKLGTRPTPSGRQAAVYVEASHG